MDLGLAGLKALITGGSRGIGRAIAERLAAEGCDVAICARGADEVKAAVAALGKTGVKATGRALDVADGAVLAAWVADAGRELGGLDIVIANASALASGCTPAAFRQAFAVDLMHTVNAVNAAMPLLERSRAGAIVAISSISGVEDYGIEDAAYGTMKAALLYYMKSLANHLAPKHIRANVVSPGSIYFKGGVWHKIEQEQPEVFRATLAANPMGRMGRPEEIANAVAFAVSPVNGFMAGANIVVDGAATHRVQF
ncbi:MAG: SDR family oxidoreductase [Alphaproteobacteria bacterium]|nr:SDR family oxidoreductase [Alphaproteobacteria bacterium]